MHKQFPNRLHRGCHHREVDDLFKEKPEPLDDDRPDCGDGAAIPGLSAWEPPDASLSPITQQKCNPLA